MRNKIFGAILLAVGILLVVVGVNASHSIADRVSNTFTGRFTEATTWYIVSGAAVGLIGLFMVLFMGRRRIA